MHRSSPAPPRLSRRELLRYALAGTGLLIGGGWGPGGVVGHPSWVRIASLSLTVVPPASPVTVAVFGTTLGSQSAGDVVFREHT